MDKKNRPLVSVVLPTYNRAWCLKRAVDSVLEQDYPHIEVIVIDDGSTDDTQNLLESYAGRIIGLRQANKGVSAARNLGIQRSTGLFAALLDSDDAWDKRKISCQVDFFLNHPGAMICQTQEIWIRNGRRVNPKQKHQKPAGMIFDQSLHLCLISPSAVMIKKKLLEEKGLFNESFKVCEDYDLWLRITHDTPVYLIDKPYTFKYGGHDDQLSGLHSQDKYRIRSMTALIRDGCLSADQKEKTAKVLREKCRIYANGCLKRGRIREGEYYLGLAQTL